jgi:hypothetical protein
MESPNILDGKVYCREMGVSGLTLLGTDGDFCHQGWDTEFAQTN